LDAELVVMHGDTVIGVLRRIDGCPSGDRWLWSITALYVRPGAMTMNGVEETKEAAKGTFGKTLRAWLQHIGADDLTDEILTRHGIGSRPLKR
jgi:hypothetical protein